MVKYGKINMETIGNFLYYIYNNINIMEIQKSSRDKKIEKLRYKIKLLKSALRNIIIFSFQKIKQ